MQLLSPRCPIHVAKNQRHTTIHCRVIRSVQRITRGPTCCISSHSYIVEVYSNPIPLLLYLCAARRLDQSIRKLRGHHHFPLFATTCQALVHQSDEWLLSSAPPPPPPEHTQTPKHTVTQHRVQHLDHI